MTVFDGAIFDPAIFDALKLFELGQLDRHTRHALGGFITDPSMPRVFYYGGTNSLAINVFGLVSQIFDITELPPRRSFAGLYWDSVLPRVIHLRSGGALYVGLNMDKQLTTDLQAVSATPQRLSFAGIWDDAALPGFFWVNVEGGGRYLGVNPRNVSVFS